MPASRTKASTQKLNSKQRRQKRRNMMKPSRNGDGQGDESRDPTSRPAGKKGKVSKTLLGLDIVTRSQ